jgi:hypothetical protein
LQVQAVILGFHLSKLHACAESNLELVSLDKTRPRHDRILHNKLVGLAIVQMYILNLHHLDVEIIDDSNPWSNRHNTIHLDIEQYTSMP